MPKGMRVYELARELDISSKEILDLLKDQMNIELNNHMASINDQVASKVRQLAKAEAQEEPTADGAVPVPHPTQAAGKGAQAQPEKQPPATRNGTAAGPTSTASGPASGGATAAAGAQAAPVQPPQPATATNAATAPIRNGSSDPRARGGLTVRGGNRHETAVGKRIELSGPITVGDLAQELGVSPMEIIRRLMTNGIMAAINQQIDADTAVEVGRALGAEMVDATAAPGDVSDKPNARELLEGDDPDRAQPRAPVVAVLGHVDHGKTTLLDAIRSTRVAKGEAGGITQHIGASTVRWQDRRIVFLDTPGHEAFTAMRARGAQVTDVTVLVVAADDGVMPQTVEAISHAKNAEVPIIVAVNKMDVEGANPDRVLKQLAERDLLPEEWGGDTPVVRVSAAKGSGIDDLLEMITLVADLRELKADPERPAVGTVVEAQLDRGRGPVATVLVQSGTLHRGDAFVAGSTWGKVRAMVDDLGRTVKQAGPATPVEVLGFEDVPAAGDVFEVKASEQEARQTSAARHDAQRQEELEARKAVSLADFHMRTEGGADKELRLIIKADVQGSLEAIRGSLEKVTTDEAYTTLIHTGVGAINASDVMLAGTSDAVILGFNVRPDAPARHEAEQGGVEIKTYRVIYDLVDDVRDALTGLLSPTFEEVVLGQAEVRQTFKVPGAGMVAGCYVQEGKLARNATARLVRDGVVVHDGTIASLRRFKDDVREVAAGYECGVGLERFNDVKEGDVIEAYEQREVARG